MSVSAILLLPAFTLALNESTALLVAGGTGQSGASRSVELWRPNQPPCHLPDLPEDVEAGTLDLLGNEPTLCQLDHCLHFTNNEWQNGSRTIFSRLILNKMTRIPEKNNWIVDICTPVRLRPRDCYSWVEWSFQTQPSCSTMRWIRSPRLCTHDTSGWRCRARLWLDTGEEWALLCTGCVMKQWGHQHEFK